MFTRENGRLQLIPCEERHLELLIESDTAFEAATGWKVAQGYMDSPEALPFFLQKVQERPEQDKDWWNPRLYLLKEHNLVVGMGGYKGPPKEGEVEIGYSVAPEFQGQGLATEAAIELTRYALLQAGIEKVNAHTLQAPNGSTKVLQKSGFVQVGEAHDREDGYLWVWESFIMSKAHAYIVRERDGQSQVLVFRHRDFPEAGFQIPGGTMDGDETPEVSVLREVEEESGLASCEIVRMIHKDLYYSPSYRQWHKRHFFIVNAPETLPERWEHTVSHGEYDKDLVFCYEWWSLERAAEELIFSQREVLKVVLEFIQMEVNR